MSQSKRNNKGEKRNKQSPTIDWGLSQCFFSQQHKLHQSQSFDITNTSRMRQKERTPAFSCPLLWHVHFASRPCRPVQHCYNSATRTTKYSFFFTRSEGFVISVTATNIAAIVDAGGTWLPAIHTWALDQSSRIPKARQKCHLSQPKWHTPVAVCHVQLCLLCCQQVLQCVLTKLQISLY